MGPLLIRRRADGVVQIRRARARDLVLASDIAILLTLLAGWLCFTVLLVISLLFEPPLLAMVGWVGLALAVEHRGTRRPRLVELHATPPPGSAA